LRNRDEQVGAKGDEDGRGAVICARRRSPRERAEQTTRAESGAELLPHAIHGRRAETAQANRLTKSSAVWATSRQPWSIVRAWPRFGIFTMSVTAGLRRCRLYAACAIAHGTVWSFSPSMISRGPRRGFFVFTLASVHGLRFALPICASAIPEPATWNVA